MGLLFGGVAACRDIAHSPPLLFGINLPREYSGVKKRLAVKL